MPPSTPSTPRRGDMIWMDFDPMIGHEQPGFRPALVLSADKYNERTGLVIVCPITKHAKGYDFEVPLPAGLPVAGVILCDQVKCADWVARRARFAGLAPPSVMTFVVSNIFRAVTYPNSGEFT